MAIPKPFGYMGSLGSRSGYASLYFDPDLESQLTRTDSGLSPSDPDLFTLSFWVELNEDAHDAISVLWKEVSSTFMVSAIWIVGPETYAAELFNTILTDYNEAVFIPDAITSTPKWIHIVIRYDSDQVTASNRIRIYVNGGLQSAFDAVNPSSGRNHDYWSDGQMRVGGGEYDYARIAFIDMVDGFSFPPEAFGFNNDGTWTRIPYGGSYGNLGFRLDGSAGSPELDTSGNGHHFTNSNVALDYNNLPPYVDL